MRLKSLAAAMLVLAFGALAAHAQPVPGSAAERIYAAARPKLLQIRTVVAAAGRQSSLGSGFLVGPDGLAATNYHVISQYALDPATYRLEYTAADGETGTLTLLAIDVANDLAVVRLSGPAKPFFAFDPQALAGALPKGEPLYSLGNPLDLGFTIVEGTYNGMVDRAYAARIHFTGALNPGMSGGPAVTADGRVAGVNVSKRLGGEQVSFLVPARYARDLVARARNAPPLAPDAIRAEIGRQLARRQRALFAALDAAGLKTATVGPYRAAEPAAPWFTCWARTNAGQIPPPRARQEATSCTSDTQLFVALDLATGTIQLTHTHIRSDKLNEFQFAALLTRRSAGPWIGGFSRKWYTPQRCHTDFVAPEAGGDRPRMLTKWCARAYREFEGLYDVGMTLVTQDSGNEALVTQMRLQAVPYGESVSLAKRIIGSVRWAK